MSGPITPPEVGTLFLSKDHRFIGLCKWAEPDNTRVVEMDPGGRGEGSLSDQVLDHFNRVDPEEWK